MSNPQIENGYIKIATELFEALCKIKINAEARQVFDFIIRKTYGWNKKEDNISFSQIELGTGINRRNAIRAIKRLKEMNLISVKTDTINGNIYCINKKYLTWTSSVNIDTVVSKRAKGSVKTCKKVVSRLTHTIDTIQKTNTINSGFDFSFIASEHKELFNDWLDYKKERKEKYKTQKSLEACYKRLLSLSKKSNCSPKEIIEQSMANNWAGLFELKDNASQKTPFDIELEKLRRSKNA